MVRLERVEDDDILNGSISGIEADRHENSTDFGAMADRFTGNVGAMPILDDACRFGQGP